MDTTTWLPLGGDDVAVARETWREGGKDNAGKILGDIDVYVNSDTIDTHRRRIL